MRAGARGAGMPRAGWGRVLPCDHLAGDHRPVGDERGGHIGWRSGQGWVLADYVHVPGRPLPARVLGLGWEEHGSRS